MKTKTLWQRSFFTLVTIGLFAGAVTQWASAQRASDDPPPLKAVGQEAFDAIVRFYDYDKTIPLTSRIVERTDNEASVREKFIFRGVRGRMVPGYLELPKRRAAPVPLVLMLHGWSGNKDSWWRDGGYISGGNMRTALLAAGFAVLAVDAPTHGDRIAENDYALVNDLRENGQATARQLHELIPSTRKDLRFFDAGHKLPTDYVNDARAWFETHLKPTVHVTSALHADQPQVERHVVVYGQEGRFGGWPANHGMWIWGNEILVGFSAGFHKDLGERHNIDREKPEHHVLARSLDGGETWKMEYPAEKGMLVNKGGMRHGTTDPAHREPDPLPITEPIDFTHPDFCMTLRFEHVDGGNARLYHSYDRGHNWRGPLQVPSFGQPGVMARTDYLINGPRDCHVFLTASKQNHEEGRVFCGRTVDGGLHWEFLSFVGPEPHGFSIMPSTVRLSEELLVTTTRRREGPGEPKHRWIDTWRSNDNGRSWQNVGPAVVDLGEGNPPSMIRLRDGRLCLTYGVRKAPFEMQARFSSDEGQTWSEPFVLQTGGGGRDLGYPRTLQRPDGKIVTVYYFYPQDSPYRRIIATIWDPGSG